jgi:perosamine synthetase
MIPVFEPEITESDKKAVIDALNKGEISGTFGSFIEDFESQFADYCGVKYGVATSSGTAALQLAIKVLELPTGGEVLLSSTTNIATALAIIHNNLVPVPVDSELITWNLDLNDLEEKITDKTVAILPVHHLGHPVQMFKLLEIAKKNNLKVIEDCAESHGATVNNKIAGSFGDLSCFSFYANKVITSGEGGMVLTNDEALYEKLKLYRNLGFTIPRFVHKVAGFNFRMTGMQAALGVSQLARIEKVIEKKREIANYYNKNIINTEYIQKPVEKSWAKNIYWMYGLVIAKNFRISRDEVIEILKNQGIESRTFFCSMDAQPVLREKFEMKECKNSRYLWENGFYIPSSPQLKEVDQAFIVETLNNILGQ